MTSAGMSGVGRGDVDVDVAVVGAGPAGSAAALRLAQHGLSVALVERADTPGAKNLSGGVLYPATLAAAVANFADAPVERRVVRHVTTALQPTSAVSLDYRDDTLASGDVPNAVTVLRARFDPWLAAQAEAAGAFLMPGMRVDALATEPLTDLASAAAASTRKPAATGPRAPRTNTTPATRVRGIVADGQLMRTHAVVLADGVNSFLARGAGLRPDPPPHHLAVGVKAVIGLDAERICERFGVGPGEGAAHALVGDATLGVAGGAFLYTNTDSLSLGVVLRLDDLVASGHSAQHVFEHLLGHPGLERYLRGGTLLEYGSHLVAEGGLAGVGPVAWPGCVAVGDAAGLTLNSGLVLRGMDLAISSGLLAGDVVAAAIQAGDTTATLAYSQRLTQEVLPDLATHAGMPGLLARRGPYGPWGRSAERVLREVFTIDGSPKRPLRRVLREGLRGQSLRTWAGDLAGIWRSL